MKRSFVIRRYVALFSTRRLQDFFCKSEISISCKILYSVKLLSSNLQPKIHVLRYKLLNTILRSDHHHVLEKVCRVFWYAFQFSGKGWYIHLVCMHTDFISDFRIYFRFHCWELLFLLRVSVHFLTLSMIRITLFCGFYGALNVLNKHKKIDFYFEWLSFGSVSLFYIWYF